MPWTRHCATGLSIALVLIPGLARAHDPPDEAHRAFHFPAVFEPTIDGNLDEWPDIYVIHNDRLYGRSGDGTSVGRGEVDTQDMDIRHVIGWSACTNKLYVATQVRDNRHHTGRQDPAALWRDDTWEIEVNVDHTGSEAHNRAGRPVNSIRYVFAVPPVEGVYQAYGPGAWPWLVADRDFVDFSWSFTGEELGEGTYYYEAAIAPIQSIATDASGPSDGVVFHDLRQGAVIHLSISLGDADGPCPDCTGEADQRLWSTSPTGGTATNDVVLAAAEDLELADLNSVVDCFFGPEVCGEFSFSWCGPTSVEALGWARIKAGFIE